MVQRAVPALITAFTYLLLTHLFYFLAFASVPLSIQPITDMSQDSRLCLLFSDSTKCECGFRILKNKKNKPQKMLERLRLPLSSQCPVALKAHWSPCSDFPPPGVCFLTPASSVGTVHLNIKCVYVVPDFFLCIYWLKCVCIWPSVHSGTIYARE